MVETEESLDRPRCRQCEDCQKVYFEDSIPGRIEHFDFCPDCGSETGELKRMDREAFREALEEAMYDPAEMEFLLFGVTCIADPVTGEARVFGVENSVQFEE